MLLSDLANELILHIFQSCASVPDVLHLAATCHHFRTILTSQQLPTLFMAAEAQFGPLSDAISLVTHNATQPPHIPRPAPALSLALLTRLLSVGRIANKWAAIYPIYKWRGSQSSSRRLLTNTEHYRLRRACYRLWLYTLAFHTPRHPRTLRKSPPMIRNRALLLHPIPTVHLAEIMDFQSILRSVLNSQICPSNSTVLRRHRARYPDDDIAPVLRLSQCDTRTVQMARQRQTVLRDHFHASPLFASNCWYGKDDTAEGWGDEISQYYVIEDMLKIAPGQLLFLLENAVDGGVARSGNKHRSCGRFDSHYAGHSDELGQEVSIEAFIAGLGDWFENNGETCGETIAWVLEGRGEDIGLLKEEVAGGMMGICRE